METDLFNIKSEQKEALIKKLQSFNDTASVLSNTSSVLTFDDFDPVNGTPTKQKDDSLQKKRCFSVPSRKNIYQSDREEDSDDQSENESVHDTSENDDTQDSSQQVDTSNVVHTKKTKRQSLKIQRQRQLERQTWESSLRSRGSFVSTKREKNQKDKQNLRIEGYAARGRSKVEREQGPSEYSSPQVCKKNRLCHHKDHRLCVHQVLLRVQQTKEKEKQREKEKERKSQTPSKDARDKGDTTITQKEARDKNGSSPVSFIQDNSIVNQDHEENNESQTLNDSYMQPGFKGGQKGIENQLIQHKVRPKKEQSTRIRKADKSLEVRAN